ncbi:DUF6448 family protein [Aerococcus viridans]|uniref:DUF6448 family protein n=1 Tax=Aerococcus viridans TaxID=1377 RepID=UPI003BEF0614
MEYEKEHNDDNRSRLGSHRGTVPKSPDGQRPLRNDGRTSDWRCAKALAEENSSYIAKWVLPEREEDIEGIFAQVMEVRDDSPEAQKLADQYLFENLVRIHSEIFI